MRVRVGALAKWCILLLILTKPNEKPEVVAEQIEESSQDGKQISKLPLLVNLIRMDGKWYKGDGK